MTLSSNLSSWKRFSIRQKRPDQFRGPLCLLLNGYRGSFEGTKQPGRELNHSHISSAEIKNGVIFVFPMACTGRTLLCNLWIGNWIKCGYKRQFACLRTSDAMFYSSMLQVARLGIARFSFSRFFASTLFAFCINFFEQLKFRKTKRSKCLGYQNIVTGLI